MLGGAPKVRRVEAAASDSVPNFLRVICFNRPERSIAFGIVLFGFL